MTGRSQQHSPLDRACTALLQQARAPHSPDRSPAVELMSWGLDEGGVKVGPPVGPALAEQVGLMLAWPPEAVSRFLEPSPTDQYIDPEDLSRQSPVEAAESLLSLLHDRMLAENPAYAGLMGGLAAE